MGSLSLSSRALCGALCLGYALSWSDTALRSLALTPGLALPFRLFQFATYALFSSSLAGLLATAPLATYLTHVLDPIQGQKGLGLIVVVAVVAAGLATWFATWLLYVVSSVLSSAAGEAMVDVLYTPICGFYAGTVALLVALMQAAPGETAVPGLGTVRTAALPLLYAVLVCAGQLVWGRMVNCLVVVCGLVAAWVWLRYFHPGLAGLTGDPSDQFKLLSFFPDTMQRHPGMTAFSDRVDVRMRAWAAEVKDYDLRGLVDAVRQRRSGSGGGSGSGGSGSVVREEDSARRRERGMKSLEARGGGGSGGGGGEQRDTGDAAV